MKRQVIITIAREYGSRGHKIAEALAKKLGIELYDKKILLHMAENEGFDHELIKKHDEKRRRVIVSRKVNGHSNSIEDILAHKIFDYQRALAASGESFVIVGRCSDYVFRDNPNAIRVFVTGDYDTKLRHVINDDGLSPKEAVDMITKMDKHRRNYHNHHCDTVWADSRTYDLTLNASKLGIDNSVEFLFNYVKLFLGDDFEDSVNIQNT